MISIVIPTFNEEENINILIPYLQDCCKGYKTEIIVSDCGSTDRTVEVAKNLEVKVVICPCKGRSTQMNCGAAGAVYDILYFVHADSIPPLSFCSDIIAAVNTNYEIGRYRTRFEGNKWILKLNAFFTRFDWFMCYGGDQTLFITKSLFKKLHGYEESLLIMEEYDLVKRAKQLARYKIFSKAAIVSVRKYHLNSWFKVQKANYITVKLYKKGISQTELVAQYKKALKDIK
ncbi:MAG: TIGR04283 family arsenosugar biosynthesis glycosyltransferase [Ferruginibacter sp.]